ncbi:MAG: 30S ribosome-binding factor RbfA [Chloroflexi bacterium]|nr:30S ribosome-binding factor RbfA [Chloroflexota bacterium]MCH8103257.1 30S ribosome-binding factor RbfA [Chloroflexota bacterium]
MPAPPGRKIARVNSALKRELGKLITTWLLDPRVSKLTSVSRVTTARDLGRATVYVAVLGSDDEQADTLTALKSGRVALRHMLKDRIRMRNIPQLVFKLDNAQDEGADVLAILDEMAAELSDKPVGEAGGES